MEVYTRLAMGRKPEESGAAPHGRARGAVPSQIASLAAKGYDSLHIPERRLAT